MLQKCPSEDDGSVEYAATKVRSWHKGSDLAHSSAASPLPSGLQIHQYLITKTAKDCSIMVALVPGSEREEEDEG